MTQLQRILMAILAIFGRRFALPTSAARRKGNKSGGFNFPHAFCAVCFAAIIGGTTFANSHFGLLSAIFTGNAAWAQAVTVIQGNECKHLLNGKWVPCSPSAHVNKPNAAAQELENAKAKTIADAQIAAQEASLQADAAKRAADAAKRRADAAKKAANAAKRRADAIRKATRAQIRAARESDAGCAAAASGNSTALANCARSRHAKITAAKKAARAKMQAAAKAVVQANKESREAAKAARKAKKAAKKAMALAQVKRDYATCVATANGDSTALSACHKSHDSAIKAAKY